MVSVRKNSAARQVKVEPILFDVLSVCGDCYYMLGEGVPVDEAARLVRENAKRDDDVSILMIPSDCPLSIKLEPCDMLEYRRVDLDLDHEMCCEEVRQLKLSDKKKFLDSRKEAAAKLKKEIKERSELSLCGSRSQSQA